MEIQRLVVEESESALTVDFHSGLTVCFHENPVVRHRYLTDVLESLGPARAGVHLELVDSRGHHLAVFRPRGGQQRVIDIDAGADVTARFCDKDGRIDLLGRLGLDSQTAAGLLRLGASQFNLPRPTPREADSSPPPHDVPIDLTGASPSNPPSHTVARRVTTDPDPDVYRLATIDGAVLWTAALAARDAEVAMARARAHLPALDAEAVRRFDQLSQVHAASVRSAARHRPIERLGVVLAAGCIGVGVSLLAVDARIDDNGFTGQLLVLLGLVAAGLTLVDRLASHRSRRHEQAMLHDLGARDFTEVTRTAGPLADAWRRQAFLRAAYADQQASTHWRALAGDISAGWALRHRPAIEATGLAPAPGTGSPYPAPPRAAAAPLRTPAETSSTEAAQVLVDRLVALHEVGGDRESLPLLLDEPFAGLDGPELAEQLGTLLRLSIAHQIVLVTGDPFIRAWAINSEATNQVSFVRLSRMPTSPAGPASPGGAVVRDRPRSPGVMGDGDDPSRARASRRY